MRKILFRGKRNGYAEQRDRDWLEGSLLVGDNGECEICYGTPRVRITYSVIPETVGQYTGLLDKNGKKIFEGDIVRVNRSEVPSIVEYSECNCGFHADSRSDDYFSISVLNRDLVDLEVIGNIYDNPELLEAQS